MPPRLRRVLATGLKLLGSLAILVAGLELGTRLLAPETRFELIPNTFDPVCRIRQRPDAHGFVHCPEYRIEIHTSGDGFREEREYAPAPAATVARVLCLGDSFTCGLGVAGRETFAKVADRRLGAEVEVINAGVVATGTAEQLAWYELAGRRYHPDLVVLAFCSNDWTDNAKGGLFSLAPDSTLVQHPATERRLHRWLRGLRTLPGYETWYARSHFLNRFRQWYAARYHGALERRAAGDQAAPEVWRRERALTEALLRALRDACARDGATLLLMPVPALPGSGEAERRQTELLNFLERQDIARLDLRPALLGGTTPIDALYYPVDGHWTPRAHAIAGEELAGTLAAMLAGPAAGP